jgi:hypothetical protein
MAQAFRLGILGAAVVLVALPACQGCSDSTETTAAPTSSGPMSKPAASLLAPAKKVTIQDIARQYSDAAVDGSGGSTTHP